MEPGLAAPHVSARPRALVRGIPSWLVLGGIVVLSVAYQLMFVRRIAAPFVFADELIYSELGKSLAAGHGLAIREAATTSYGAVYPAFLSPSYALFERIPDAYAAMKATNAVLMSLAAVPVFFLARRALSTGFALLAAALAVAVPSMVYTGTLMTENAFYPVFCFAALAIVASLERPTTVNQLAVFAAIAVAYLTRAQAVALLPAFVTAIAVVAALDLRSDGLSITPRRLLARASVFRVTWLVLGVGALAYAAALAVRAGSPAGALGAYSSALGTVDPLQVPRWFLYHLAELDLYVGVIPFAAFLLMLGLRGENRSTRILIAASAVLVFWMTVAVAGFATQPLAERVHERNLFYVVPLILVVFLVWMARGLPRPRRATWLLAALAAGLPLLLPFGKLAYLAGLDALALVPWVGTGIPLHLIPACVAAATVPLALCFAAFPRRYPLVLPTLVLCVFFIIGSIARTQFERASGQALAAGISGEPDWIDRAVGPDARVVAIWPAPGKTRAARFAQRRLIWESEFFNRSIGPVVHAGGAGAYQLAPVLEGNVDGGPLGLGPRVSLMHGALCVGQKPVDADYVLADRAAGVRGEVVAHTSGGVALTRVPGGSGC
jgi:hypothetical protein